MRNPVNRLATAAPRALDSILKIPSSSTTTSGSSSTGTSNNSDKSSSAKEGGGGDLLRRSRGASFHLMDLSLLYLSILV